MAESVAERLDDEIFRAGIFESVQLGILRRIAKAVPRLHRNPLFAMKQRPGSGHDDQDFFLEHMFMPSRGSTSRRYGLNGQSDRLGSYRASHVGHARMNSAAKAVFKRFYRIDANVTEWHGPLFYS